MNQKNLKHGFAPFVIIAVVAVVLIAGGFALKSKKPKSNDVGNGSNKTEESSTIGGQNSLGGLLALGRDLRCTFTRNDSGTNTTGTVYLSQNMMRGDFSAQTSGGVVESHMITKGESAYVWTGSQGMHMSMANMKNRSDAGSASQSSGVNFDDKLDYKCENWTRDASYFETPKEIKFIDFNTMMQGAGTIPTNVNIPAQ